MVLVLMHRSEYTGKLLHQLQRVRQHLCGRKPGKNPPMLTMSLGSSTQGPKRSTECLESQELQTPSSFQDNPLQQLQLASQEVLEKAKKSGRSKCPRCSSSRMFYCYTCFVPVETVPTKEIPTVKLPLKIDIIKHPNETDGKSTAVHAKLLAPDDVTIYKYPCIPEYEEKRHEIALIFPGPNSVSVKDIAFHLQKYTKKGVCNSDDDCSKEPVLKQAKIEPEEEKSPNECIPSSRNEGTGLKKIIFIDSTWNQTNKIITDERLQGLLQIELKTRKTCFWRHQKGKPDTYLSTIEAIYYFLVDYHQEVLKENYKGQYDNLLFFFSFMYTLIKNAKCCAGKE
ncbi:tRNA-uridine aminocarboxypropyltransferase 1 isoform X2 [Pipra filicauda]|uniref:tRNA-uridine aminocarboxypropyltransferase 1 n=1 Tax=Pipra filicauda TaxID=649802 RepID=A0A6J2HKH9_9PASS|nr:tRNA-uridine aminocarboxypropyltransferase 1 isoform X2 [Pipra filicauda]XP_027587918.1 tRNA-uridine aminocarboxypropyltransferase 1 isoform X2 [Pipra filicauda]XP_039246055.1 tRNA-uridine aminocarboxypropyltransferase 1 isoform X2 [Pipra filicauda]